MTPRRSRAVSMLAAAAALACAGTAGAQSTDAYNPNDYVLLNGSYAKPDSDWPTDKRPAWGGGLKLGIPISPQIDLQIGGNVIRARNRDAGLYYHQYLLGVDGLWFFTPGGFRPFILGGVG